MLKETSSDLQDLKFQMGSLQECLILPNTLEKDSPAILLDLLIHR